jgi:cellulose synthase/poly-beta-1,6-N-acetylglucosamine synthase-like glycosyltransferase
MRRCSANSSLPLDSRRSVISILLPFRDAAATLAEAVASVLGDMNGDDELVLVDDGSRDASTSIASQLAECDPRIACVASGGIGVAGALTRGLERCNGEWIARMDADDVSLPGRLRAERELLEREPLLGAVATRVELFGANVGDGIRRYVDWQNQLVSASDHARSIFVESPVCHPSTMLRRSALDAVGGYHSGEFAEDYDLWLRLVDAGWGIAKVPDVLFRWRIHGQNVTWNDPRTTFAALRRLRARHLARKIDRPFGIWGAGAAGTRLSTELATHGARASFFIDIDPLKVGRTRHGGPILDVKSGLARTRADRMLLIVAVAVFGARDLVRAQLADHGFVEGRDFICAA